MGSFAEDEEEATPSTQAYSLQEEDEEELDAPPKRVVSSFPKKEIASSRPAPAPPPRPQRPNPPTPGSQQQRIASTSLKTTNAVNLFAAPPNEILRRCLQRDSVAEVPEDQEAFRGGDLYDLTSADKEAADFAKMVAQACSSERSDHSDRLSVLTSRIFARGCPVSAAQFQTDVYVASKSCTEPFRMALRSSTMLDEAEAAIAQQATLRGYSAPVQPVLKVRFPGKYCDFHPSNNLPPYVLTYATGPWACRVF